MPGSHHPEIDSHLSRVKTSSTYSLAPSGYCERRYAVLRDGIRDLFNCCVRSYPYYFTWTDVLDFKAQSVSALTKRKGTGVSHQGGQWVQLQLLASSPCLRGKVRQQTTGDRGFPPGTAWWNIFWAQRKNASQTESWVECLGQNHCHFSSN